MKMKVLLVLAVVAGGFWVRSVVATSTRLRYQEAQDGAITRCKAFRRGPGHEVADVCRVDDFSPNPIPLLKDGLRAIADARAAFDVGATATANLAMDRALDDARRAEGSGTAIGEVAAAKLVRQALDLIDRHPAEFSLWRRLALMAGLTLERGEHPFEADRTHHDWTLARWNQLVPVRPLSPGVLADEMEEDRAHFDRMAAAVVRGDIATCTREADAIGRRSELGYPRIECDKMLEVRQTATRLRAVRAEARREVEREG
jgi:hypothetical protein